MISFAAQTPILNGPISLMFYKFFDSTFPHKLHFPKRPPRSSSSMLLTTATLPVQRIVAVK